MKRYTAETFASDHVGGGPLKVAYTEKGEGYGGDTGITDASGRWIAAMMDYEEDAQEIVKVCNAYPRLVDALRETEVLLCKANADGAFSGTALPLVAEKTLNRARALLAEVDGVE